jgi:hypothetical protein
MSSILGGTEMKIDHSTRPLAQVRRADRAVTDEGWIKEFLRRAAYGALATAVDGQPFINTNLFVYDETARAIYLHTAQVGRTQANVQANPRVCFSVSRMGRLLPAAEALEFSVEYAGVVVFGAITQLMDNAEKEHGLQLLLDKYFPHMRPGRDYRPITPDELKRTAVYRLNIEQWSGKQKKVEADFPGAVIYEDVVGGASKAARSPAASASNPAI